MTEPKTAAEREAVELADDLDGWTRERIDQGFRPQAITSALFTTASMLSLSTAGPDATRGLLQDLQDLLDPKAIADSVDATTWHAVERIAQDRGLCLNHHQRPGLVYLSRDNVPFAEGEAQVMFQELGVTLAAALGWLLKQPLRDPRTGRAVRDVWDETSDMTADPSPLADGD